MDMVFTPHWNRYAMNAWTIADLLVNQVPGPRAQGSISQKRGTCTRRIDPRQWQINRLRFCHKLGNTQYTQLNVAHELPQKLRGKRPLAHSKALCWWVAVKEAASAWWSWISFGQKFPPSSVEIQCPSTWPLSNHIPCPYWLIRNGVVLRTTPFQKRLVYGALGLSRIIDFLLAISLLWIRWEIIRAARAKKTPRMPFSLLTFHHESLPLNI